MKKQIINSLLVIAMFLNVAFARYSTVGGIAYKDKVVVTTSANLAVEEVITSVNASGATVTTGSQTVLPTRKSVIILDSTSATLNFGLLTKREVDGAIKHIYCKAYTLPIVIDTEISINVTAVGGAVTKNVIENFSGTNITFTAAGQAKTLMYRRATDRYMVISTQTSTNLQSF